MAASNLPLTQASSATHHSRSEQYGTNGGDGKPIIAQVVAAAEHVRVYDGIQSLVLTGSSQTITPQGSATHATIYAEGATANDVARYWEDGSTPTASVGKRLKDHEEISCSSLSTFKAINQTGTVTLRISYYHYA